MNDEGELMAIMTGSCGVSRCVACGERTRSDNHHCPSAFENRRQGANKAAEQDYLNRRPAEATRLNYGFYLLSLKGDW
jgi:hypothetical protein